MPEKPNAVIVGYGAGIAAAVARAFGREGHSLALIARDAAKLDAAAGELSGAGYPALGFAADAGLETSLTAALDAAKGRYGPPSVLVYNAAMWRPGPVMDMTADELVKDFRIDVGGALVAARAVVPAMKAAGRGTLLFTGGGFALYPSPVAPSLSIGKAGIRSLALMLAQELAPAGIRVGTVTILGKVEAGTKFDPDRIADAFVQLHRGKVDATTAEVTFA